MSRSTRATRRCLMRLTNAVGSAQPTCSSPTSFQNEHIQANEGQQQLWHLFLQNLFQIWGTQTVHVFHITDTNWHLGDYDWKYGCWGLSWIPFISWSNLRCITELLWAKAFSSSFYKMWKYYQFSYRAVLQTKDTWIEMALLYIWVLVM